MARDDHGGMTEGKKETLGVRVQRLRGERAWSQDQLAGASELSLRTVQRVENGKGASPETLQSLAAAFGVKPNILTSCQNGNSRAAKDKNAFKVNLSPKQKVFIGAGLLVFLMALLLITDGHFHFFKHLLN